jgi:hypothetical protein
MNLRACMQPARLIRVVRCIYSQVKRMPAIRAKLTMRIRFLIFFMPFINKDHFCTFCNNNFFDQKNLILQS